MAPQPTRTDPIDVYAPQTAPRITLAPTVKDATGAEWVHADYQRVTQPWEVEAHVPPTNRTERFGDVESWAEYVTSYAALDGAHLLTWAETGLRAILDYIGANHEPGRCTWLAVHPFEQTVQWQRWTKLANGEKRNQQMLLEALEDYAEDIVEPSAATIAQMLRTMRGTVSASFESTLNEDGSYKLVANRSATVKAGDGELTLPNEIKIAIPVFKGHTELAPVRDEKGEVVKNDDGTPRLAPAPVRFKLKVRIRVNPDDDGHLLFRLSMPDREAALEQALANRVEAAETALGDGYSILRATTSNAVI